MPPITDLPVGDPSPMVLTFHLSGNHAGAKAAVVRFTMPFKMRIDAVQVSCDGIQGSPTSADFDVNDDGTTILSADIAVTVADAIVDGSIVADTVVAKDSVMTIDLAFTGGSTPSIDDATILIVGQRE